MNGRWLELAGRPAKVDGAAESISTDRGYSSASAAGPATALVYLVVWWVLISVTDSDEDWPSVD